MRPTPASRPQSAGGLTSAQVPKLTLKWAFAFPNGASLKEIAEAAAADSEQHAIRRVMQDTKGNKSEAARLLRTDYKTLHLKMKLYGIPAGQFKES